MSAGTDPSAGDVICVLDALGECRQFHQKKLITYLERFYSRSVELVIIGKLFLTSRSHDTRSKKNQSRANFLK